MRERHDHVAAAETMQPRALFKAQFPCDHEHFVGHNWLRFGDTSMSPENVIWSALVGNALAYLRQPFPTEQTFLRSFFSPASVRCPGYSRLFRACVLLRMS